MQVTLEPIAFVTAHRLTPEDDFWGGETATITLHERFDETALAGLESFSHVEIVYLFHQVAMDKVVAGARHPRNNPAWPAVGIFAQRAKNRPNRIGTTLCKVLGVAGRTLTVAELDAIDGTPVLDIKPVMQEFLPREPVRQPPWASELMAAYWSTHGATC